MTKTLFVCYWHGCKGEGLARRISQHSFFKTLDANVTNNRTIIKNEYFNKVFLNAWEPDWPSIKLPTNINIVVPSHFWYDKLKKHFPEAYFVSIDIPKDIETFKQKLYDRFYTYKTKNISFTPREDLKTPTLESLSLLTDTEFRTLFSLFKCFPHF